MYAKSNKTIYSVVSKDVVVMKKGVAYELISPNAVLGENEHLVDISNHKDDCELVAIP